jgi:hypothetical protein
MNQVKFKNLMQQITTYLPNRLKGIMLIILDIHRIIIDFLNKKNKSNHLNKIKNNYNSVFKS